MKSSVQYNLIEILLYSIFFHVLVKEIVMKMKSVVVIVEMEWKVNISIISWLVYENDKLIGDSMDDFQNHYPIYECSSFCTCDKQKCNLYVFEMMKQRNQQQQRFSIKKTERKGYGLFTCYTIEKGEFVIEYVGEMIRSEEVSKRIQEYKKEEREEQYILEMREHYDNVTIHTCIDATRYGNEARFVNHSCNANCCIQIVRYNYLSIIHIDTIIYLFTSFSSCCK